MKIFGFGLRYRIYDTGRELSQKSRKRSKKSGSKYTLFKVKVEKSHKEFSIWPQPQKKTNQIIIPKCCNLKCILQGTYYGHSERVFFSKIPNFWAWADKLGRKYLVHLGIFSRFISTHFGTVGSLSMFPIISHYFYKKLSLYIQIPKKYF